MIEDYAVPEISQGWSERQEGSQRHSRRPDYVPSMRVSSYIPIEFAPLFLSHHRVHNTVDVQSLVCNTSGPQFDIIVKNLPQEIPDVLRKIHV